MKFGADATTQDALALADELEKLRETALGEHVDGECARCIADSQLTFQGFHYILDTYPLVPFVVAALRSLAECATEDWWCEDCQSARPVDDWHEGDDLPTCEMCEEEMNPQLDLAHRATAARNALALARSLGEEGM